MTEHRIHRAVSADGTEIAGRVHGQGPPLVLVHGGLEDGDLCWTAMLPFLTERFTCYLMSRRGRGLSGASPDLRPERLVEDVAAFVDSIGEPVAVFGESDGGPPALGAAARTDAVTAVAVYEPAVLELVDEELGARMEQTVGRVAAAVSQGRLAEAARTFSALIATADELAGLPDYLDEVCGYMPNFLQEFEQFAGAEGPGATDPTVLAKIAVPVLLLHGSESAQHAFFTAGVRHVAEHVADPRVREIPGAGHFGVTLAAGAIADELIRFLAPPRRPPVLTRGGR